MSPKSPTNNVADQRLIQGLVPRLRLFWGVAPANLLFITRLSRVVAVPRGTTFVERGTRLPGVFGLAYGSVKVSLRGQDGEERVLQIVTPGQSFGEAKAFLGRSARWEAIALADSKLVVMPPAAIFTLVDRDTRFARSLTLWMAEHSIEMLREVETAMQRGAQRLAVYLGALAETAGGNGDSTVRLPVSKTLVAARLGLKKETLSRLLRSLAERGLIAVANREVRILDRSGLDALGR